MDEQKKDESVVPPVEDQPIGTVTESDMKTPSVSPTPAPAQAGNTIEDKTFFKTRMGHIMLAALVLVMIGGTAATVYLSTQSADDSNATVGELNTAPLDIEQPVEEEPEETLDYTQLPLGDGMFVTNTPRQGFLFSCSNDLSGSLFEQGPWINSAAETWNLTEKIAVDGEVEWPNATYSSRVDDNTRVISSNGLPVGHATGTFPVTSSDDAFAFNPNTNQISEQEISLTVPLVPSETETPTCVGEEVGIATSGALIFSALSTTGHDVVATEVFDECQGQPQEDGFYHYHGYSSCFLDTSGPGEHSDLLGYALDGFGIFGIKGEDGTELSSSDLDECHGHKHNVEWDGETVSIYHYHFTQDYPYTVSCFKGTPLVESLTVGESIGEMMGEEMEEEGGGPGGPMDDLPAPPGQQ